MCKWRRIPCMSMQYITYMHIYAVLNEHIIYNKQETHNLAKRKWT